MHIGLTMLRLRLPACASFIKTSAISSFSSSSNSKQLLRYVNNMNILKVSSLRFDGAGTIKNPWLLWNRWIDVNRYKSKSSIMELFRRRLLSVEDPHMPLRIIIGVNCLVYGAWTYSFMPTNDKLLRKMEDHFTSSWRNFSSGRIWTMLTASVSHISLLHLGINMFMLWSFGSQLLPTLGTKRFLGLYMAGGIAASATSIIYSQFIRPRISNSRSFRFYRDMSVGASGSLYSLLVVWAGLNPSQSILIFFILPLRAPIAVAAFIAWDLYYAAGGKQSVIDSAAHLGGGALGLAYLGMLLYRRRGVRPPKYWRGRRM